MTNIVSFADYKRRRLKEDQDILYSIIEEFPNIEDQKNELIYIIATSNDQMEIDMAKIDLGLMGLDLLIDEALNARL